MVGHWDVRVRMRRIGDAGLRCRLTFTLRKTYGVGLLRRSVPCGKFTDALVLTLWYAWQWKTGPGGDK